MALKFAIISFPLSPSHFADGMLKTKSHLHLKTIVSFLADFHFVKGDAYKYEVEDKLKRTGI